MAKTYLDMVKYEIRIKFEIEGIVDKPDIIGAVFGQSEGLVGEEMDLRELQKNGKLGRIDVKPELKMGKTAGMLVVPSSMDMVKTSLLAAAIEAVDKVGPCAAKFETLEIEDMRSKKRQIVADRAKELLQKLKMNMPETQRMADEVRENSRVSAGLTSYGKDNLPAGPDIDSADEVIVVEGRADVINLLKHNIANVIAIDGSKIPPTVVELAGRKRIVAFLDGDRGGDLIARQLKEVANVEVFAKAPDGKEVEELTGKEILTALRRKSEAPEAKPHAWEPSPQREFEPGYRDRDSGPRFRSGGRFREPGRSGFRDRGMRRSPGRRPMRSFGEGGRRPMRSGGFMRDRHVGRYENYEPANIEAKNDLGEFAPVMKELENSLKAKLLDNEMKTIREVSVRDLLDEIRAEKQAKSVVFDGIVTKRLVEAAEASGIETLVGVKKGKIEGEPKVRIITRN